jgi:hypothetical protein
LCVQKQKKQKTQKTQKKQKKQKNKYVYYLEMPSKRSRRKLSRRKLNSKRSRKRNSRCLRQRRSRFGMPAFRCDQCVYNTLRSPPTACQSNTPITWYNTYINSL